MRSLGARVFGCVMLAMWFALATPLAAQEDAPVDPMAELLERLGQTQGRIGFLQERYEAAEGEDLELYADQLIRRWQDHHALLLEMVEATRAAREAGTERLDATDRIRLALGDEVEFLRAIIETKQARIAELRLARPDTPVAELGRLELELTDLNSALDRLITAGVEGVEMAAFVGLDLGPRVALLDARLSERAALLAARIELAADQKAALLARAGRPAADSAAIQAEVNAVEEKLFGTTASLQTMVDLLEQRGLETADYRQLLLETTGSLGTNILDVEAVGGLISDRWTDLRQWFEDHLGTIGVRLLTIVAILLAFAVLARLGRRATRKILRSGRVETSELLKNLLIGMASKLIWLIGFLVVLSIIGIDIGPMLAGLGIAGFVLGFALQDTLSNFASGLMIMGYRPFDVGDLVNAGGVSGTVKAVTLVSTVVTTLDNQVMIIPNNKVWGDVINNVTAQDKRRVDLVFGIGYGDDMRKAQSIMQDVVRDHPLVLEDPEPVIRVHNLGESSVDFICRPWCATDDYWDVYWDLIETVKRRFDEEGVSIPFPQRDVHLFQAAPEA